MIGRQEARRIGAAVLVLGLVAVPNALAGGGSGGVMPPGGTAPGHHHHRHHQRHHHHTYHRHPYLPPHGRVFHGVSETITGTRGVLHFQRQVGAHPAVVEDFYHWGTPLSTGALDRWHEEHSRGLLSVSTAPGDGVETITPRQIANGRDDHYLVRLNQTISNAGQVVYLRPFGEMNGYWNPYSAFNSDGSARPDHSTKQFIRAWRRFSIVVRGGSVGAINRHLTGLGMPKLLRAQRNDAHVYHREGVGNGLSHPHVAFVWNPQTISSPNIPANRPSRYWPGRKYVDWVGADIYSKFASTTVRTALGRFQHRYRHFPFVIGEYAPWDNDSDGKFVRWLFRWAGRHTKVRMLVYYRSVTPDSAFEISRYPKARRRLRHILDSPHYMPYAPGLRP